MCKGSGAKLMKGFSPQTERTCTAGRKILSAKDIKFITAQSIVCKEGWQELEKLWMPTEPRV